MQTNDQATTVASLKEEILAAATKGDVTHLDYLLHSYTAVDRPSLIELSLFTAATYGHATVIRELVTQHGAPVDATDADQNTALHLAAKHGNKEAALVLIQECQANVNAVNNERNTPLHEAAKAYAQRITDTDRLRYIYTIHALIKEGGADVRALNHNVKLPIEMVCNIYQPSLTIGTLSNEVVELFRGNMPHIPVLTNAGMPITHGYELRSCKRRATSKHNDESDAEILVAERKRPHH